MTATRWTVLVGGVLFVALFLLGTLPMGQIGYLAPAEKISQVVESSSSRMLYGGYLGTLSAFFLLCFVIAVRGLVVRAEPRGGGWSDAVLAGGIAASIVVAVALSGVVALAGRAGSGVAIGSDAVAGLYDMIGQLISLALPVALAVLVGGAGFGCARAKILPLWFGWVSAVVAVGLLSPVSYLVLVVALAWVVVVSIWLFVGGVPVPAVSTSTPVT